MSKSSISCRAIRKAVKHINIIILMSIFLVAVAQNVSAFEPSPGCGTDTTDTNPGCGTDTDTNTQSDTDTETQTDTNTATNTETDTQTDGPNSMGFIGCSMAENTAAGYRAIGGQRMWGPYGTGGDVVQNWTDPNSAAWDKFDQQVAQYGQPTAVWVQICIFASSGATYDEVKTLIANARQHAAPDATIYITGQPLYDSGWTCNLAGSSGPELTDELAQRAGDDPDLNVIYPGTFGPLGQGTTSDSCHANSAGEELLGQQAVQYFGE